MEELEVVICRSTSVPFSGPIESFTVDDVPHDILVHAESMFIGLHNGLILEWSAPGAVRKTFSGHQNWINSMVLSQGTLWSSSRDCTIRLWNVSNGECLEVIRLPKEVTSLVEWRGVVVSGGRGELLRTWNAEGTLQSQWYADKIPSVLRVWGDYLSCGSYTGDIIVWKDASKKVLLLQGHEGHITCLVTCNEFLFSGSRDNTVRKWSSDGNCVGTVQQPSWISCMMVQSEELYVVSFGQTVRKYNVTNEQSLHEYFRHGDCISCIVGWAGAIFTGGWNGKIVRWTDFYLWSPATHKVFSATTREGIKTLMVLASTKNFPSQALSMDVLMLIFQYYASVTGDTDTQQESKKQRIDIRSYFQPDKATHS